jgi:trafficking kinesin-binding protein 2
VVNEVYRVIVKQNKTKTKTKNLTSRRMGKAKRLKLGSNLLGELKRNQSLSVLMGCFGAPICTYSPKMGILKEN